MPDNAAKNRRLKKGGKAAFCKKRKNKNGPFSGLLGECLFDWTDDAILYNVTVTFDH